MTLFSKKAIAVPIFGGLGMFGIVAVDGSTLSAQYITNKGNGSFSGPWGAPTQYQMLVFARSFCGTAWCTSATSILTSVTSSGAYSPQFTAGYTPTSLQTSADLVFQKAATLADPTNDATNFNYDLTNVISNVLGVASFTSTNALSSASASGIANGMFISTFGRAGQTSQVSSTDALTWAKFLSRFGPAAGLDPKIQLKGLSLVASTIINAIAWNAFSNFQSQLVLGGMVTPGYSGNDILDRNLKALSAAASKNYSGVVIGVPSYGTGADLMGGLMCAPTSNNACTYSTGATTQIGYAISNIPLSDTAIGFVSDFLWTYLLTNRMDILSLESLFVKHWNPPSTTAALQLVNILNNIGSGLSLTRTSVYCTNALAALMWMFSNPATLVPA